MTTPVTPNDDLGIPVVAVPATAECLDAVVRFLVGELVAAGKVPAAACQRVVERVIQRESLGSTGIGGGLAIPHARSDDVAHVAIAIGRLPKPIDWAAIDGEPVELVCLMIAPRSIPSAEQKDLEELMRRLRWGRS